MGIGHILRRNIGDGNVVNQHRTSRLVQSVPEQAVQLDETRKVSSCLVNASRSVVSYTRSSHGIKPSNFFVPNQNASHCLVVNVERSFFVGILAVRASQEPPTC